MDGEFFPLNVHLKISLIYSRFPSLLSSLFSDTRSPPRYFFTSGGGITNYIPCIITRKKWIRCSCSILFVIPIKSSTHTSMMVHISSGRGEETAVSSSILCSNLCGGRDHGDLSRDSMISRAVSNAAQKNGGDLYQPIWRLWGTAMYVSSI